MLVLLASKSILKVPFGKSSCKVKYSIVIVKIVIASISDKYLINYVIKLRANYHFTSRALA